MTTASPITPTILRRGRSLGVWAGMIGAPAIWAIQLQLGYSLAPWACESNSVHTTLHIITIICILLALLGGYLSWIEWKRAGAGSPESTAGGIVSRARFTGAMGMAVSATAAITILAQGIASFFFEGCWQ